MKKKVYLWMISIVTAICVVAGIAYHTLGKGRATVEQKETLEAFDSVHIEADTMQIDVVTGTGYELQYSGNETYAPTYEIKNGMLVIKQKKRNWTILKDNKADELCLTVPASAILNELNITSDIGEVYVEGVHFDKGSIRTDIGAVSIEEADFNSLEITSDIGEVSVVDAHFNKGSIGTDIGAVSVEEADFNSLEIKSDIGEVEAKLLGAEEDYTLGLFTKNGEIEIDHATVSSQYVSKGNTEKEMKITTDIGAIEIGFEKQDLVEK